MERASTIENRHGGAWEASTERHLQYVDTSPRLFIARATPAGFQPTDTTIVDAARRVGPR